jgi:hypothetical protein
LCGLEVRTIERFALELVVGGFYENAPAIRMETSSMWGFFKKKETYDAKGYCMKLMRDAAHDAFPDTRSNADRKAGAEDRNALPRAEWLAPRVGACSAS